MSTEPTPPVPKPKPPGKIAKFFKAIFGWPKKLWRLSVPTKAAIVVTLALTAIVIIAWTSFFVDPDSVPWRHTILSSPGRIVALICLLALIPLVVYRGLKLWLEGDASRFPDIDFAWRAGMTALGRNGIDITSVPIFLVIGSSGERQERALFDSAGLSLHMRHRAGRARAVALVCQSRRGLSLLHRGQLDERLAAFEDSRSLTEVASSLPSLEAPAPVGPPITEQSGFRGPGQRAEFRSAGRLRRRPSIRRRLNNRRPHLPSKRLPPE